MLRCLRCFFFYWLYNQLLFLGSGLLMGTLLLLTYGVLHWLGLESSSGDAVAAAVAWLAVLAAVYKAFALYWRRLLRSELYTARRLALAAVVLFFACAAVAALGFYRAQGSLIAFCGLPESALLPLLYCGFLPLLFSCDLSALLYGAGGQLLALIFMARYYFAARREHLPYVRLALWLVLAAALCLAALDYTSGKSDVVPTHHLAYERGLSSTDLQRYKIGNKENILPRLDGVSTLRLPREKWLVLDGAEAAFPVYSAFANACYEGIADCPESERERYVRFYNTIYGFEYLLDKTIDIFFGALPSEEQRAMARANGEELVLTPVGREAFVFFVNQDNPLENLTVQDIRDIYSGRVRSWSAYTGEERRILAFQRPKNSGSQTLLQQIMGGEPLIAPLKEEYVGGMGGMYSRVAAYNGAAGAIGYSFRFFAGSMVQAQEKYRPKIISINGVYPSDAAIKDGSYPFVTQLYAVTLRSNKKPALPAFLQWMQGAQGQEIVEKTGYIGL